MKDVEKTHIYDRGKGLIEPLSREVGKFTMEDFLNLHQQFMTAKKLEGLAPKTLDDHEKFMRYFEN